MSYASIGSVEPIAFPKTPKDTPSSFDNASTLLLHVGLVINCHLGGDELAVLLGSDDKARVADVCRRQDLSPDDARHSRRPAELRVDRRILQKLSLNILVGFFHGLVGSGGKVLALLRFYRKLLPEDGRDLIPGLTVAIENCRIGKVKQIA